MAEHDYAVGDYFKESEHDSIKGFAIVDTCQDDCWHIAEKDTEMEAWLQYEIPKTRLEKRVEGEYCEKVGEITEDQRERILANIFEQPA